MTVEALRDAVVTCNDPRVRPLLLELFDGQAVATTIMLFERSVTTITPLGPTVLFDGRRGGSYP